MRRTLIELAHMAIGVVGAGVLASLAAWAVPPAQDSIWQVAFVVMALVVVMGARPLRTAWRADRTRHG